MESENKKEIEDCKSYEQRCEDTKITDKVVTHVEISFYFDKIIFPRASLEGRDHPTISQTGNDGSNP
ncbi:hypothetical protein P8452_59080 [Trifolium repens]|nr:hypothetical protein P8452_59080 [Trifolium repens]